MRSFSMLRLPTFVGAVVLVSAAACRNAPTSPEMTGRRSPRDTALAFVGDTTACRSGWVIINGRVACN